MDRTTRSLLALNGAATSRVLNLCTLAQKNARNPDHQKSPLFLSPILNTAIYIKHPLRADEADLLKNERAVGTKVVIPFDNSDLRAGGRSFLVRQTGYQEVLDQACHARKGPDFSRDIALLDTIDQLPSLDPFLLRERVRSQNLAIDECYFLISPGDQERMHDYCAAEVTKLVTLAAGNGASQNGDDPMVQAFLSTRPDQRLEPLRVALGLSDDDFREGVFCWRGFLYYKWNLGRCIEQTGPFLQSLTKYDPRGSITSDDKKFIVASKRAIATAVRDFHINVRQTIEIYDRAYSTMIDGRDPTAFRAFLLTAPKLFLQLGDKIGVISHILSLWQHRCQGDGKRLALLEVEDFTTILNELMFSLGVSVQAFAA